ncbi:MAG: glucose-1-phosphate thymidylyltransferase, partial [bacterium]
MLAGGKGTRLRPLTYTRAKQLIPVANKPILFYGLESLAEAGVKDVAIIIGETGSEIRHAVGDGSPWGLRVDYIVQPEPLGLAHAVKIAHDYLRDSPFIMYLGDNIIKEGVKPFVEQFGREKPNALILLSRVRDPQRFGVAELSGGRVVHLVEKPKTPKSDLALVGVYIFDSTIFDAVNSIQPSARGEFEITDAIQYQIDRSRHVSSFTITGWWKDTGKLEDLLEANQILLNDLPRRIDGAVDSDSKVDGCVVIEPGATVAKSTIRGPAI